MITLLVMSDGRKDCIAKTIPTALKNLNGPISVRIIHDDSGDPDYGDWLWDTFGPKGFVVHSTPGRSGFAGAIRSAWAWLREHDLNDYIVHLEDDFLIDPIWLGDMAKCLDHHPELTQLALLRQPWNADEKAAGGIIEQHPDDYTERYFGPHMYREHRRFWTTNPSMYRRSLITEHDWPHGGNSEGNFGIELFNDPDLVAGYWGDGVNCEHIGHSRIGTGY